MYLNEINLLLITSIYLPAFLNKPRNNRMRKMTLKWELTFQDRYFSVVHAVLLIFLDDLKVKKCTGI